MALQGTLDTFSLPDVLRLLATTGKTGCLHVEGDRGRGNVWLDGGAVVGATAERALNTAAVDEVIFEMLRFGRGSFNFAADEAAPEHAQQPKDVESMLRRATQLLDEWRGLEAVVPSLSHRVALAPELTVDQVTIDAPRWQALVAIASGRSVGELAENLDQGELGVSRTVSDLVELGVAVVEPPSTPRSTAAGGRRSAGDSANRSLGGETPRRATPSTVVRDAREPREPRETSVGAQAASAPTGDNGRPSWRDEPAAAVETAPKPRSAKSNSNTRPPRQRRPVTTPGPLSGNGSSALPGRNGSTGLPPGGMMAPPMPSPMSSPLSPPHGSPLASPPHGSPLAPAPVMTPPHGSPLGPPTAALPVTDRRSPLPTMPPPGPSPEALRGPILPPSLDTGRLGPSPLPHETGQIPAVSATSLPPDLSWAAEDNSSMAPVPPLSPLTPPPAPSMLRTPPPTRLVATTTPPPQPMRTPNNGRHHDGDTAPHVGAMSPDARSAVEVAIGRSGGGPAGMPMGGATQEQVMSRGQLLRFLSSVRP